MSRAGKKRPGRAAQWGRAVLPRVLALAFPRRCPFCGEILTVPAPCALCAAELEPFLHCPPLLAASEFPYLGQTKAAAVYHYKGRVPRAILHAKEYGCPWYAQELADLMAVRLFGAQPAKAPGLPPTYSAGGAVLRPCDGIVPVPSRRNGRMGSIRLPYLLAKRLGDILEVPVYPNALECTRATAPQKTLDLARRGQNQKGAYRVGAAGVSAVEGRRILLVDDTITTGATVSACAQALLQGGAYSVLAVSIAADDEPPQTTHFSGEQQ